MNSKDYRMGLPVLPLTSQYLNGKYTSESTGTPSTSNYKLFIKMFCI
jgi:hypothetical protein